MLAVLERREEGVERECWRGEKREWRGTAVLCVGGERRGSGGLLVLLNGDGIRVLGFFVSFFRMALMSWV